MASLEVLFYFHAVILQFYTVFILLGGSVSLIHELYYNQKHQKVVDFQNHNNNWKELKYFR